MKIRKLANSSYLRNFALLSSSTILVQIVNAAISPILTRLYSSEQLGAYTLAISILSVLGPVICARYDLSIVVAKNDKEVANLIVICMVILGIFTFLSSIWYIYYVNSNPVILKNLGYFSFLIIILLLITGITNVLLSYNNRYKEYKLMSQVTLIRGLSQSIGQAGLGFFSFGSKGLLISYFLGSCLGLKKQSQRLMANKEIFSYINKVELANTFKKYRKQLLYGTPSNFISGLSYTILNFFITSLYGLSVFGYYSISFRILGLPLALISVNLSKIFFQEASEENNKINNFLKSFKKNSIILIIIGVPLVILLMLFSPTVFPFIFGRDWSIAGRYVVILAPMFGIRLIVSSLSPALIIVNKQNVDMMFQIIFMVCAVMCYGACNMFKLPIESFLTLISISYGIVYLLYYFYIKKCSKGEN